MPTLYLSSTYEDLKEYRHAGFEALRKSGYQVIAREGHVAAERRPVQTLWLPNAKQNTKYKVRKNDELAHL